MLKEYFNIAFAYPWVLTLLLLIPFIGWWYWNNHRKASAAIKVTTTHFLLHTKSWRTNLRHLPFFLRCAGLAFIILALARPQEKYTEDEINGEGIDIVLCFDISGSMTEKDMLPNRLEASKQVALDFLEHRRGDKVGVVIFSKPSFTLCPITTDHNTVKSQISNIESGYLQEDGTSIGSGLATSVDRLRMSKGKSKVVILLTDGVDQGGSIPPDIAKEMAKLYNVKVYTIGIGSEDEIQVPVETALGTVMQKKKLEFNEGLLKTIASETGGQYFHATTKENLQGVYDSIDKLEKSRVEIKTYNKFTEKYHLPLMVGFCLVVLELVLRLTVFKKFP